MSEAFGPLYAKGYDLMYREKDYPGECDLLEKIWRDSGAHVSSVLDLGSGTGAHSLELARRGYEVIGVDRSEEMVAIAEAKCAEGKISNVSYVVSDIAEAHLDRSFDAAIMMFNVIGYLADQDQRTAALANVRSHLKPGSPFVFDYWYGPAVLMDPPIQTTREIPTEEGHLVRSSSTHLDVSEQLCDITIDVARMKDGRVVDRASERHQVRFFFPEELSNLLLECGFELTRSTAFSNPTKSASTDEWSAVGSAKAF